MNRIPIKFVESPSFQLPIKPIMNSFLDTWPDIAAPSVLQVAAHLDEFISTHPEFVVPLRQKMSFTDLMLHPEKIEAVLKDAEVGNKSAGKPVGPRKVNGREVKASGRASEKKTP
jgi:hypothetical protein